MPSTFKFPKNISKYEVDWSAIEVERYPIHDDMKMYIQALTSSAKFRIHGGVLLEHNPSWDRGTEATEETMRRFYYLVSSDLALKEPPLPTKSERILFWSHATDVGSLWSMLRNRDMLPMSAHGVASFGCNIFYALGHEVCGGEEDEYNIARVLYNTNKSAKNLASVVVGGKAWGSLRKVYGGSVETARGSQGQQCKSLLRKPQSLQLQLHCLRTTYATTFYGARPHQPVPPSSQPQASWTSSSVLMCIIFCIQACYMSPLPRRRHLFLQQSRQRDSQRMPRLPTKSVYVAFLSEPERFATL